MAKNTATKSAPAAVVTGESEIDRLRAELALAQSEIERLTVLLQSAEKPEGSTLRLARDADYSASVLAKTLANCASEAGRVRVEAATKGFKVTGRAEIETVERAFAPNTDREKASVAVHVAAFRLHAAIQRLGKVK